MLINVFSYSSSSYDNDIKIETSLFVLKPYLRSKYIETSKEEEINLKNKFRIKNLPDPISIREAAWKNYVDNKFNNPSIIKNTSHIDLNDKSLKNIHSIKLNSLPTIEEHLTPKYYVDNAISDGVDNSSLLRLDPD